MHHGVHGSKYQRSYLLPAVVLRSVKNHPPNAQVTIASPQVRVITLLSNYERTSTPNFTILFSPTFPPTLKSCWRLMKRNGNQRMASVSHVPIDHKACDVVKFHGFFQLKTIKQHLLFLPKTCGDQNQNVQIMGEKNIILQDVCTKSKIISQHGLLLKQLWAPNSTHLHLTHCLNIG